MLRGVDSTGAAVGVGGVGDGDGPAGLVVVVLGTPGLVAGGRELTFPPGRPGRLLASLLLARGRVVATDRLVDEVWGDDLPADARATLHTTVARSRRALGVVGERLQHQEAGYRFDLAGARIDADVFLGAVREARARRDLASYEVALAAWHGTPWAPWAADIAQGEALRLSEAHVAAREERAGLLLEAGRLADAVGELQLLVAEQPLRDRPVALLMEALHRTGAAAEALAVFSRHREELAEELGLDPAPELVEQQRRVLLREHAVTPEQDRDAVTAKTARRPEPSVTRGATSVTTTPTTPTTPLVRGTDGGGVVYGRDRDLADLRTLTALHRCVTLVGPGGVGKTTLARRATADEPSTWWVDLAAVTTEAGVRAVAAAALSVEVFPGGTPEAALRRRLAIAEGVLVLDNCEHVIGPVADLVMDALEAGSGLRVLATSRERVGLPEEHVHWLAPLELPRGDAADREVASVALFLDRARAASPELVVDEPTLAAVSSLVRTLDGLPLAIELAASRVGVVSLSTLQRRLEDRLDLLQRHHRRRGPARHQTLTATIEWSYDLLTEEERRAFRWLATFAGPFTLDDAESLLGTGSAEPVIALVERSLLVRPGTQRDEYRMLETLRSFARSRIDPAEARSASAAHGEWAAAFAATARQGLTTRREAEWHALVERRLPDLAQAVRRSLEAGEVRPAARIATELCEWAYARVRVDVLAWGRQVAEHPDPLGHTPGVLAAAAWHAWNVGEHELARDYALRGMEDPARPESLPALAAAGDTALAVGDLDTAHELNRRAHTTALTSGEVVHEVNTSAGMVLARVFADRPCAEELALLEAAMARTEAPSLLALGLYSQAEALAASDPERALDLLARARATGSAVHARLAVGVSLAAETALRGRVGALDAETVEHTVLAVEHWLGSGNENLFITCLRNVVPLLDRFEDHRGAVALMAATQAHTAERPPYGAEKDRLDAALRRARDALSEDELAASWREGASSSLEAAAVRAIADLRRLV